MDIIFLSAVFNSMDKVERASWSGRLPAVAGKSAGSICSWRLLGWGLKKYFAIDEFPKTEKAEGGKPFFTEMRNIHFSLSHTDGRAICAIYDSEIGCDIEKTDRRIAPVLKRKVAAGGELELLAGSADPDSLFIRLWTMKEATLKKRGTGLGGGIMNLDMSAALNGETSPGEVCTVFEHQGCYTTVCADKNAKAVAEIVL